MTINNNSGVGYENAGLKNNQTKQIALFAAPKVPVEKDGETTITYTAEYKF